MEVDLMGDLDYLVNNILSKRWEKDMRYNLIV